jgi:hypothetical protein
MVDRPFDSVARHSLKLMRGKESLSEQIPPLRFLLETFTGADSVRSYKVVPHRTPMVKAMLGLRMKSDTSPSRSCPQVRRFQ